MAEAERLAKIIWDYHHLNEPLAKADVILALGSQDLRVAEYGAKLFLAGWAPWLMFSGGRGFLTQNWPKTEAETFAQVAVELGVPPAKILLESRASNTGENILFSKQLLGEEGLAPSKIIVVHKPYMERRTYATFKKVWPSQNFIVTSPQISLADYLDHDRSRRQTISVIARDLYRIKAYPKRGFQIPQAIPLAVWRAYERLVELGYGEDKLEV